MIALFYFTLNFTVQFIQFGAYHNYIYKVPCSFLYALLCIALYINRARIIPAVLFIACCRLSLPVLCLYPFSCPAAVACCRLCFPFCVSILSAVRDPVACCRLSLPVLCAYSLIFSFAVPVAVVAPCSLSLFLQLFGILWPAFVVSSCSASLSSQASGSLPAAVCRSLCCVPIRSYVLLPCLPPLRSLSCAGFPSSCPAPCLLSLWFPVPLSSQVSGFLSAAPVSSCAVWLFSQVFGILSPVACVLPVLCSYLFRRSGSCGLLLPVPLLSFQVIRSPVWCSYSFSCSAAGVALSAVRAAASLFLQALPSVGLFRSDSVRDLFR